MKNNYRFSRYFGFLFGVLSLHIIANPLQAQWVQIGLDGFYIRTITAYGSYLFVGTSGDGMFRSTNNGASWVLINSGLIGLEFPAFAVSGTNLFAGEEGEGVFRSTNSGTSWTATGTLTNPYVFALAVSGTDIFAGTDGYGVSRSTNNGTSWTAASSGMTNLRTFALAVSGANLFAGTFGGGVFRSTNNGTNWTAASSGLTNTDVWTVAVSGTNLYAGTSFGAFMSANNGTNWTPLGLSNSYIHTFAFSGTNIFTGTDDEGVFRSTNNGASWIAINEGFIDPYLYGIWVLTVAGPYIYAGSNGNGVWRRPLSEIVSAEGLSADLPAYFSLEQNYPNPFNPGTEIKFDLPKGSFVRMVVYDMLGREVRTLINEFKTAGSYSVDFNGSNLSSGIYFYKLVTDEYIEAKKMVLIK